MLEHWCCGNGAMGIASSTVQRIRSHAADDVWLLHNADPAVQAGIECVKQWLVIWHNADEFVRTRVRHEGVM